MGMAMLGEFLALCAALLWALSFVVYKKFGKGFSSGEINSVKKLDCRCFPTADHADSKFSSTK